MKKFLIHRNGDAPLEIEFPEAALEWKLRHYIDFLKELDRYNEFLSSEKSRELNSLDYKMQNVIWKSQCVVAFLGITMEDLFGISISPLDDIQFEDSASIGIHKLFTEILNFVNEIKPREIVKSPSEERYVFTYRGRKFYFDPLVVSGVAGKENYDLKLGHYIEILDRKRKLYDTVKDDGTKDDKPKADIDPTGSKLFTKYLTTIAVLSSCEDTIKPTSPEAFERYVRDTIPFLQDIDIQTAIDIDFFLSIMLTSYQSIPHINGFLSLQTTSQSKESIKHGTTQSKKRKPRKHSTGRVTDTLSKELRKQVRGK